MIINYKEKKKVYNIEGQLFQDSSKQKLAHNGLS